MIEQVLKKLVGANVQLIYRTQVPDGGWASLHLSGILLGKSNKEYYAVWRDDGPGLGCINVSFTLLTVASIKICSGSEPNVTIVAEIWHEDHV
jgi:hypothetical protein